MVMQESRRHWRSPLLLALQLCGHLYGPSCFPVSLTDFRGCAAACSTRESHQGLDIAALVSGKFRCHEMSFVFESRLAESQEEREPLHLVDGGRAWSWSDGFSGRGSVRLTKALGLEPEGRSPLVSSDEALEKALGLPESSSPQL